MQYQESTELQQYKQTSLNMLAQALANEIMKRASEAVKRNYLFDNPIEMDLEHWSISGF